MMNKLVTRFLLLSALLIAFTAGALVPVGCAENADALYTPGTYTATASGKNGDIVVQVTFEADKISAIEVLEHSETAGIADAPIARIPEQIIQSQSLNVDAVGGATVTSEALIAAVKDCVEQAGADADALMQAEASETEVKQVSKTADVVVVGGGGAGLSAAIEASLKGASVILLEKQAFLGGNTAICGGLVPGPGTELQRSQGIEDSPEKYAEDIMKANGNTADPDLVKVATQEAVDLVPWFESLGAEFIKVVPFAGNSVDRLHQEKQLSGAGLVNVLQNAAELNHVEILLETAGVHLIQDESGAIVGVKAQAADGTEVTVNAKAVILATGGFAANDEMLAEYIPEMIGSGLLGNPGNTGDAIKMGLEVGADLNYVDAYLSHAGVNPEKTLLITWEAIMRGGIIVNEKGERFVDEAMGYAKCAPVVAGQDRAYIVVDDYIRSQVEKMATYDDVTVKASSPEELAAAIGVDADTFAATLAAYNESVSTGSDAYGRTVFEKPLEGNLYAINVETYLLFTTGGLRIDTSARVLNEQGEVIPGLYAAGEAAGTSVAGHGYAGYITGEGLLSALTFGRIAGRHAGDSVMAQ